MAVVEIYFGDVQANLRRLVWLFPLSLTMLCSCDVHKKLADFHYSEAEKRFDAGDLPGAIDDISAAISQNPNWGQAYAYRGYVFLWTSNYVAALTNLDAAVNLEPDNSWAYFLRGLAKDYLDDYEGSVTNYNESLRIDPNYAAAWSYRGLARAELKEFDEALSDINHAIDLDSSDSETYVGRAYVQLLREDYESVVADASRAIELNSTNSAAYQYRGSGWMWLKNFTNALVDYDEAVTLDSHDADAVAGRGMVKLMQDKLGEAEADLDAAARLSPSNATAFEGLGIVKIKRGDLQGALAIFTNALTVVRTVDGEYPAICRNAGELQRILGQNDEALQNFHKVVKLNPHAVRTWFSIWLVRVGRHEQAEASQELRAALASQPPQYWLQWELSIGHFLVGDLAETNFLAQALTTARRPTDRYDQLCRARYYAGMKRLLNGDRAGAIELLEQCVALHQDNESEYTAAVVQLRELKGQ